MKIKSYLLTLLVLFLFFSCDNDDSVTVTQDTIIGNWKLTQYSYSIGGPEIWKSINNGAEFEFLENGTFTSTLYSECASGTFSFNTESEELTLAYDCENFSSQSQNETGQIIFFIRFNANNEFLLSAKTGPICIEGCRSKYTKQ